MNRKVAFAVAATLLTLTLGACSGSDDAPVYTDNATDNADLGTSETAMPTPEPSPVAVEPVETVNTAVVDDTPPPVPAEPDQQMMDDASATGMTSRSARKDLGSESPPAEDPTEGK
ncbi:hypothetical protein [Sphingomonas echinoides]|uniref:hypothetical protein n=1 Tax=Sphingomonas echinoides TaxID=59803 RepID=UPI0024135D93|nr:hypothetical protein [Sphingomonas echinoides]